ncbi:MAG: L-lactate permease [Trueperaceae bacterium]
MWLALAALLPILLILILMLALHWSAVKAGLAGCVVAFLIALLVFDFGTRPDGPTLASGVQGVLLEAGFSAFTILWIIFPALCIHHLQLRTKSLEVLQGGIRQLSGDPRIIALLVAWFFALFMEGAAGFGTSAALAAPFLVSVGFKPVQAVSIALVGHAVGVSFGAVGTPIAAQVAASNVSGLELAATTARYHAAIGWIIPFFMMGLVGSSLQEKDQQNAVSKISQGFGWAIVAAICFLLPYLLIAQFLGPELPTLGGALVGGLAFVIILRSRQRSQSSKVSPFAMLGAAAPYLILVGLVVLTRLIPPLREGLQSLELSWSLYGLFEGSFAPLYHPGTLLLLSFLLAALWQRATLADISAAVKQAASQLVTVTLALLAMLTLSRLMVHAGMINTLAEAAATTLGGAWPLFAPWVGVLGTFVTGSATASNILFTDFQVATATTLELPVLTMLGAQGFGAAVGNIICPHNIIAAGATVALVGQEGAVLRRTLGICLLYALLGGVGAWLFS